jgi:hypothetical protein
MNRQQRAQLNRMIEESGAANNTPLIREKQHSFQIDSDIKTINRIIKENPSVSDDELRVMCSSAALFLFSNYTPIFNKAIAQELNMDIMTELLKTLRAIETGQLDQHEASVRAGQVLKELYVDSALRRSEKINKDDEDEPEPLNQGKEMSWSDFKKGSKST